MSALLFLQIASAEEVWLQNSTDSPDEPIRTALLIGVNAGLGGAAELAAPERDVASLAHLLHDEGFLTVGLLTGSEATKQAIEEGVKTLAAQARGEQDLVLVYVAAHGVICPLDPANPGTHHLRIADTTLGETCWEDSLTDDWLLAELQKTPAGQRVMVLDACLTDFGVAGEVSPERRWSGRNIDELILRSTSKNNAAFEVSGRLLYTTAFIQGLESRQADLDGSGAVSALEAHDYASRVVIELSGGRQPPSLLHTSVGEYQEVNLVGEPGAPTFPVMLGLAPGIYGFGEALARPLGPSGALATQDRGPVVRFNEEGRAVYRVHGTPRRPRYLWSESWIPGRTVGLPALSLQTGFALSEDDAVDQLQLAGRVRRQVTPEWSVGIEGAAWQDASAAVLTSGAALHWRSWTLEPGLRGGLALGGQPEAIGGGELSLRRGVREQFAVDLTIIQDRPFSDPSAPSSAIRAGLMWDPNIIKLRHEHTTLQNQTAKRRASLLGAAAGSAIISGLSYGLAWRTSEQFYSLDTDAETYQQLQVRTNLLQGISFGTAAVAVGFGAGAAWER